MEERIICLGSSYQEVLQLAKTVRLEDSRSELSMGTFDKITRRALVKTSNPN